MKKIGNVIMCIVLVLTVSANTLLAFAQNKYSIEDLYVYFDSDTLPTWREMQDVCSEEYNAPEDAEEKREYNYKRELCSTVITGFEKSSAYSKFKKEVEKYCYFDSEHNELLPIGYSEDEEDVTDKELKQNESKYDKINRDFDKAISQASVRSIMDMTNVSNNEGWLSRTLDRGVDFFIGNILVIIQCLDRIAVTLMSLKLTVELIYMSVEISRPILGFEGLYNRRKVKCDEDGGAYIQGGRTTYVDDHSTQFRLVGKYARMAVEQEYKISEDMSTAVKDNILKCYALGVSKQIAMLVISVLLVSTGLWSEMVIWIAGAFSVI